MKGKSNVLVGNAGEHYVCAELSKQGIVASLPPKNNPLFDIVATKADGSQSTPIQVKTMSDSNKEGWKLGNLKQAKGKPSNVYIVLVNLKKDGNDFYIYRFNELFEKVTQLKKEYLKKPKKNGDQRKDPGFLWFNLSQFNEGDKARRNNWNLLFQK